MFIQESNRDYIYRFTFASGKVYIGRTIDFKRRWNEHRQDAKSVDSKVYNAWRKYGEPKHEIIFVCDFASGNEKEIKFIAEHDSMNNGYNSTPGGEGNPAECTIWREKNLVVMKALNSNPDVLAGRVATMTKMREQPDFVEKLLGAAKEWKEIPGNLEYLSERSSEWNNRPENLAANSERMKKKFAEDTSFPARLKEWNDSLEFSAHLEKIHNDPKIQAAISSSLKNYHAENPDVSAAMSERMTEFYKDNPKAKIALSDQMKKQKSDPNFEIRRKVGIALGVAKRKSIPFSFCTVL